MALGCVGEGRWYAASPTKQNDDRSIEVPDPTIPHLGFPDNLSDVPLEHRVAMLERLVLAMARNIAVLDLPPYTAPQITAIVEGLKARHPDV